MFFTLNRFCSLCFIVTFPLLFFPVKPLFKTLLQFNYTIHSTKLRTQMNRIPLFDYEECYRYVPYCFVFRKRTQDHYLDLRRFVAINLLVIIQRYFLRKRTYIDFRSFLRRFMFKTIFSAKQVLERLAI